MSQRRENAGGAENLLTEIMATSLPNLAKDINYRFNKLSKSKTGKNEQTKNPHQDISSQILKSKEKERKNREHSKREMTHSTKITVSFSSETMKSRGSSTVFSRVERKELSTQSSRSSKNIL